MPKLNKSEVDKLSPNGRDYLVWDDSLPGFGVRVFASGRKSYLIQYKLHGRTKRFTLGFHGAPYTFEAARKKAFRLLADVEDGADPSGEKKTAIRAPTVSQLADRYVTEHLKVHNKPTMSIGVQS